MQNTSQICKCIFSKFVQISYKMTLDQIQLDFNLRARSPSFNNLELHHIILFDDGKYRMSSWSEYVAPDEDKCIMLWDGPTDWRDDAKMEGKYKFHHMVQFPTIETEDDILNAVASYCDERVVKYSRKFETDYFRHELIHHVKADDVKEVGGRQGLYFRLSFGDIFVYINETMVYVTKMPNYLI